MFGIDDAVLFAGGAKLLGGFLDNKAASDRQDSAQAFSAQQYATRYQTQVADMKAAGLNPMLAYTQAPGNSPGGVVSSPGNQYSSVADTVLQSKMNSAQIANVNADTKNKEASADLIAGQAAQAWASASQSHAMISQINASVDKIREEIKNIPEEGKRLRQMTQMLSQQNTLMAMQGKTEQYRQKMLEATTAKLHAEGLIEKANYDAIVKTNGIGRIAREVQPASDIAADWLSPSHWFTRKSSSSSTVTHKR